MLTPTRHLLRAFSRMAAAIILALIGQRQLERGEPRILLGMTFVVAAAVLLWTPESVATVWRERRYRPALACFALSTAALGAALHWHSQMGATATAPVVGWLISMVAFLAGCHRLDRARDDLQPVDLNWTRLDTLLLLGATALALVLRATALDRAPLTFSGDESQMAMEAVRVGKGNITDPFATGWLSHPTLWFFLQSFVMRVAGENVAGVRLLSALLGSATVASTYFLARVLYDQRIAAVAALLLATYHFHIHFSRLALNNVADPLWGTLILSFFVLGCRTRRPSLFGLTGLALGLALYFYPGARLFLVLVFCLSLLRIVPYLRRKAEQHAAQSWLPAALSGAGLLVAAGPLLQTFIKHPNDFMARMTVEGISRQWLAEEASRSGQTAGQVLWNQFTHAALAFNSYTDTSAHYALQRPLLWGLAAALMLLGLLLAVKRVRQWNYQIPVLWFALAIFFGGMMLKLPPGSARYVTLAPVVCLFLAFATARLLQEVEAALLHSTAPRSRALAVNIPGAMLIAYLGLASVSSYFNEYVPHDRLGGPNTHAANALAVYLQEQPAGTHVYFLGPPRMYYNGFAMLEFMARDVVGEDVPATLRSSADVPPAAPDHPTIYAVLPERREEMTAIEARYPGGQSTTLTWPMESGPMVYVYKVEPPAVAGGQ